VSRRTRPAPAYKARLVRRRERLAEKAQQQAQLDYALWLADWKLQQLRDRKAALDAKAPPLPTRRTPSLFERLFNAAAETTDRLAQDFMPKKGPGDARFFA
jgi:hypothetical protein